MHFIKEENASMGLFHKAFAITLCTSIGTPHNAEEMRHQQLGIVRIISTIEADKGRI